MSTFVPIFEIPIYRIELLDFGHNVNKYCFTVAFQSGNTLFEVPDIFSKYKNLKTSVKSKFGLPKSQISNNQLASDVWPAFESDFSGGNDVKSHIISPILTNVLSQWSWIRADFNQIWDRRFYFWLLKSVHNKKSGNLATFCPYDDSFGKPYKNGMRHTKYMIYCISGVGPYTMLYTPHNWKDSFVIFKRPKNTFLNKHFSFQTLRP